MICWSLGVKRVMSAILCLLLVSAVGAADVPSGQREEATKAVARGKDLLKQKQPAPALEAFAEAIKLDPDNEEAHYQSGLLHADAKEYEKAITDFSQ